MNNSPTKALRCRPGDLVMIISQDMFGRTGTVVMSVGEGLAAAANPEADRQYSGLDWVVDLNEMPEAHLLGDRVVVTSKWAVLDRHLMPISRATEDAELEREEVSA